jgi:cellulose synthase/poly-beta-1,6-N-acetylglucosamine synthase-like glycosyltransferase
MGGSLKAWIRQIHRWLSIAFTLGVITYMAAMSRGQPPAWLGLFALVPLIALLVTGLYMFVLPHAVRWRGAHRA